MHEANTTITTHTNQPNKCEIRAKLTVGAWNSCSVDSYSRTSLFPIPVAFIQNHSLRLVLTSRPLCACGYVCNSGDEASGRTRRSMQILAAER